jgi:hypothetical protein
MYIPFTNLSALAKTWIYQADKKLSEKEKQIISDKLRSFTEQWLVHGAPLEASFDIRFDHFVILAANDQASGCSIDSSVRIMKELGQITGIDFFNRNLIAFKDGENLKMIPMQELKNAFLLGQWNGQTFVFNNVASTLEEVNQSWLVPASSTWLKRYLREPESVQ